MNIGIITHNYPQNSKDRKDAGIFLFDFAQELARKHKVFVLCPNFEGEKELYKKVPVTWFKWSGGKSKLGKINPLKPQSIYELYDLYASGEKSAIEFVKTNEIDFVLAAWAFPAGAYARSLKKKLGTPYGVWCLGSDINQYAKLPILKQVISNTLRDADFRFANSQLLCEKIQNISHKEAAFLPAITNFPQLKVDVKTNKEKVFRFLFVGRLEKVKGPDQLIKACSKLDGQYRLSLIGAGSLLADLQTLVTKLKLEDKVEFLGQQGREEIARVMAGSDCLVIPSRNESLPLVLIEAARSGLPIVATDVGDCQRLVHQYNIGYVAVSGDSSSLAEQMKKSLQEGSAFRKGRQGGLKTLSKDFNQQKAVEDFIKLITKK